MKKKIILFSLLPIALFLLLLGWISGILNIKVSNEEEAIKRAKEKIPFEKVISTSTFSGKNQYITIHAKKENGRELYIFVPDSTKNKDIQLAFPSQGISKKKALEIVGNERKPKSILDAQLGIENNKVVWEVSFINQSGQYEYYFLDFETGDFIKRYSI